MRPNGTDRRTYGAIPCLMRPYKIGRAASIGHNELHHPYINNHRDGLFIIFEVYCITQDSDTLYINKPCPLLVVLYSVYSTDVQ